MKAIVYTQYGPPEVLKLKEVEKPTPKKNEILIRVMATAVNSGDWRLRKADPFAVRLIFGLFKPKLNILGSVFSGEVEAIGTDVINFKIGDSVFGMTDMKFGAYAEFLCLSGNGAFTIKPDNITHVQAAAIPFGATAALHFIKKANITSGQKVLIMGASGAVGSAAVQLAKYFGADVTGVSGTTNIDLVKSLGADSVIDYTKENFSRDKEKYDVVFDTVNKNAFSNIVEVIKKDGILILSAAGMKEMIQGAWTSLTSKRKVLTGVISKNAADIAFLKQLIETGRLRPVIDRVYPLEQMAMAHSYVEDGHKKGNVAITITNN
jgi:NADPH:quinone reductase-like Zn-dependent oxidoreductase